MSAGACSSPASGLDEPRSGDFFVACERPRFHDFQQPQGIFSLSAISQQLHYLRQHFMYLLTSPPPLSIKSSLPLGLQAAMLTARKGDTTSEGKKHTQDVLSAATAALLLHSPPAPSLLQQQRIIEMLVDASTFLNPPGCPSASVRPSLVHSRATLTESSIRRKTGGHDNTAEEPHQVSSSDGVERTPPTEDICMRNPSRVQDASGCCQGHDCDVCGGGGELHWRQRQNGGQHSSAPSGLSRVNGGGGGASPTSCDEAASLPPANVLGGASRHMGSGAHKGCWSGDREGDDRHLLSSGARLPSVSPIPSLPPYRSSNSLKRDCFCPVCFERRGGDKALSSSSSTSSTIVQCVVTILRLLEGGDQRTEDVGFWSWIFAFALLERFQWTQQQTMKYTKMFEKERTRAGMEVKMKMKSPNHRQHVMNPSGHNAAHQSPMSGNNTSELSVNMKEKDAKASLAPEGGSLKIEESQGCQDLETEKEKGEEGKKEEQQKCVTKGDAPSGDFLVERNSLQVKRRDTNKTASRDDDVVNPQMPHPSEEDHCSSHAPSYTSSAQGKCTSVTAQRTRSASEQNDGARQRKNHTMTYCQSSNHSAPTVRQGVGIDFDSGMRDHTGSRQFVSSPSSSYLLPQTFCNGTPQPRVPIQHPHVYFLCTPVIPPSALWLVERLLLLLTRFWREAVKCRPIIRMLIAVFAAPLVAGRILDVSPSREKD